MTLTTKPAAGANWTTWGDSLDATVRDHETRIITTEQAVGSRRNKYTQPFSPTTGPEARPGRQQRGRWVVLWGWKPRLDRLSVRSELFPVC